MGVAKCHLDALVAEPSLGLWASGKVARWMEERIERKVWPQRG